MMTLYSLVAWAPIGVTLVLLGATLGTALYDSWWSQRHQEPESKSTTEPVSFRHAA